MKVTTGVDAWMLSVQRINITLYKCNTLHNLHQMTCFVHHLRMILISPHTVDIETISN